MCTKILQKPFFLISILLPEFGLFPCKRSRDIRYFKYGKIRGKCSIVAPLIGQYPPISIQHKRYSSFYQDLTDYKVTFRAFAPEVQCPQIFGGRHTDGQTFSKNGQIVFRTSQNM